MSKGGSRRVQRALSWLALLGVLWLGVWGFPPVRSDVSPAWDERSRQIAEAYTQRCLQPSGFLTVARHRRPGPMSAREAEQHLQWLVRYVRRFYSAAPPVNVEQLRQVITAPTEQLPELIRSSDSALAAHAAAEAMLREAKGCVPALMHAAMRWQPKREGRDRVAHRELPYLTVHGIALIAGEEARPTLEQLLRARSPEVRTVAAYELSFFGERRVVPLLRAALQEATRPPFRAYEYGSVKIARRLVALGEADTRPQAKYLIEKLSYNGRYLLPALAERRKPEVLQLLRELAIDRRQYHGVRKWAADALGRVGDKQALPYLLRALEDPVRDVAEQALRAIAHIGDPSVAPQLRQVAERVRPRGTLLLYRRSDEPTAPFVFADEIVRVANELERRRAR